LLAAKLVWRIREELNKDIDLQTLFSYPSIDELDSILDLQSKVANNNIVVRRNTNEFPLSYSQKGIWFQEQLKSGNYAYNMSQPLRIKGDLDVGVLEKSLNRVISRHDTLRASFKTHRGLPLQSVMPEVYYKLNIEDYHNLSEEMLTAIVEKEAYSPIDITSAPLIRIKILRIKPEEYILIITMHHIISDAISFKNFINEITTFYKSIVENTDPKLNDLKVQYADYATWQETWINSEYFEKQIGYWRNKLNNASDDLFLPIQKARPEIRSFEGDYVNFNLSDRLSQRLRKIAKDNGVTLYMLFMSVWNTLLYSYTRQKDIIVGTSSSGRSPNVENIIGLFINTLPIRTKLNKESTFSNILRNVGNSAIEAFSNQDIPFELLLNELNIKRDASVPPLCQVFLSYQIIQTENIIQPKNLTISKVPLRTKAVQYDIVVEILDNLELINGRFEYSTGLYRKEDIETMVNVFKEILSIIAENPNIKVKEILGKLKIPSNIR
ncbi:condensation domain-containing protein, partial [Bacillus subtilis]|uniref:condensation domain-containing protein n=2 Tax=Bacillus subtilis TaxID=1423 RepID=UPI00059B8FD5